MVRRLSFRQAVQPDAPARRARRRPNGRAPPESRVDHASAGPPPFPGTATCTTNGSGACDSSAGFPQVSHPIWGATSAGTPWPWHSFPALRFTATQWSPSARYSANTGGSKPLVWALVAQPPAQFWTRRLAPSSPLYAAVYAAVSASGVHGASAAGVCGGALVAGVVPGAAVVVVDAGAVVVVVVVPAWRACTPGPDEPHAASARPPSSTPAVMRRGRIVTLIVLRAL